MLLPGPEEFGNFTSTVDVLFPGFTRESEPHFVRLEGRYRIAVSHGAQPVVARCLTAYTLEEDVLEGGVDRRAPDGAACGVLRPASTACH